MIRHVLSVLIAVLILTSCTQASDQTPSPAAAEKYVLTPAPSAGGSSNYAIGPNQAFDPVNVPVAIVGLTVSEAGTETVRIANIGDKEQQIGSWSLFNPETTRRFDFPQGYTLKPGQVVSVLSGPAATVGTPTDLIWSADRQWLESPADVLLTNQSGRLVYWFAATGK